MLSADRWEHFHHQADMGIRGYGATPAQAFAQTALAMTAVITNPHGVRTEQSVNLELEAPDLERLLVDWLNALVYQTATRNLLFGRFQVRLKGNRLRATAWGEPVDPRRHAPAVEVKGATYSELKVEQLPDGTWLAQTVVDV